MIQAGARGENNVTVAKIRHVMHSANVIPVAIGTKNASATERTPHVLMTSQSILLVSFIRMLLPAAFGWIAVMSPERPIPCPKWKWRCATSRDATRLSRSPTPQFPKRKTLLYRSSVRLLSTWFNTNDYRGNYCCPCLTIAAEELRFQGQSIQTLAICVAPVNGGFYFAVTGEIAHLRMEHKCYKL